MAGFRQVLNRVIGPVFLVLLGIGGCSIWFSEQVDEARQEMASYDASAVLACRDFRRTVADLDAGILTNAELRQRIQAVHENARLVDSTVAPGVADGARVLLAAVTQGATEQAKTAIGLLAKACSQPAANRN